MAGSFISRRTVETSTAVAAAAVGMVVASESLTHDIGWNETGPGSGYFPFRIGLLLIGAAVVRVFQVRLKADTTTEVRLKADTTTEVRLKARAFARSAPARPRRGGDITTDGGDITTDGGDTTMAFVTREELGRSFSVLWPTVVLVGAMIPLGCYVPSAAYLTWMMRRHGGYRWLLSAAYGVAIAVAFFLVFDVWFRVPLAKGPVEAALGLY